MTRSRARHANDNRFVEQKNGDIGWPSAFNYWYDTETKWPCYESFGR